MQQLEKRIVLLSDCFYPVNGWWKCGDMTWHPLIFDIFFNVGLLKKVVINPFFAQFTKPSFYYFSNRTDLFFLSLDCSFKTQKSSQDFKKRSQMCLTQLNKTSNECDSGIFIGWNRNTANKFRLYQELNVLFILCDYLILFFFTTKYKD